MTWQQQKSVRRRAILAGTALLTLWAVAGSASASIVEEQRSEGVAGGPEVEVVRELIRYLFTPGTDIATAAVAHTRWLTQALDAELDEAYRRVADAAAAHPDERYDLPSNSDFYNSWDPPTMFRLLGSRNYGTQSFVDVEYRWGPETNYPGDRRTISYVLVLTDGIWKIDDVLTIRGEFASPGSLSAALRDMPR
jgi:hypothetical protein